MITTFSFTVAALRPSFLQHAREHDRDDLGQPVVRSVAAGGEPLRDLLRRARPGEDIILASYGPFRRAGPFREFGPVYISALGGAAEAEWLFTRRADPALDYFQQRLTLRAYRPDGSIGDAVMVEFDAAPEQIERYLARADVDFIDARFPTYGCFAARFMRGS